MPSGVKSVTMHIKWHYVPDSHLAMLLPGTDEFSAVTRISVVMFTDLLG